MDSLLNFDNQDENELGKWPKFDGEYSSFESDQANTSEYELEDIFSSQPKLSLDGPEQKKKRSETSQSGLFYSQNEHSTDRSSDLGQEFQLENVEQSNLEEPEKTIKSTLVLDSESESDPETNQSTKESSKKSPKDSTKDRKKPAKKTFISRLLCDEPKFRAIQAEISAALTNYQKHKDLGTLYEKLAFITESIYVENKHIDPERIKCPVLRTIARQIDSVVLGIERADFPDLIFLDPRRHDQYIKKAFSKLKSTLYKPLKDHSTKICAHKKIQNDFFLEGEAFNRIFGHESCNGLSKKAIEFILGFHLEEDQTDNKLFQCLFSISNFERLIDLMNNSTVADVATNFLERIKKEVESEKTLCLLNLDKIITTGREFKTPFSSQENLLALSLLVTKFLKYCKKNEHKTHLNKMFDSQTKKLEELSKDLEKKLRDKKWLLSKQKKFRKSEIPAFLEKDPSSAPI
jgi:hypothetical protein